MTKTIREVSAHIDPKSCAGVLLRESVTPQGAADMARKLAQRYADSRSVWAFEYLDAAAQIERAIEIS